MCEIQLIFEDQSPKSIVLFDPNGRYLNNGTYIVEATGEVLKVSKEKIEEIREFRMNRRRFNEKLEEREKRRREEFRRNIIYDWCL